MADASGVRTYTRNSSDVLTQVGTQFKKVDGTLMASKNIDYTYNSDGSRASMTTPAGTFAYGYDNGGRWTGLRDHQNNVTSWQYDALDRMTRQTLKTGVWTSYGYNALSQLTVLASVGANGSLLGKFGHESDPAQALLHDAAGNLTREVASYDPWSSARFFIGTSNYSYDNKDQLLNESSTRYTQRNDVFGYDPMGNPTSWKGTTRTFNSNNQETTGGSSQFAYDGNGNATTYKGNTLTYDEENHLTSFTKPDGTTPLRAVYRSDGLRAWKQVASGNRYLFLYDGDQVVCGFNGNGDLSRINVWGAHGLVGRQSGTNGGTPVYDYLWDNRGNISASVSPYGGVDTTYRVTAWGEVTSDGGSYDPYRCMGGEFGNYFDQETGLVLCGQRYYDPSGGRWLTRDPIEYDGGLNLYGYVENNPVNYSDEDGEAPTRIGIPIRDDGSPNDIYYPPNYRLPPCPPREDPRDGIIRRGKELMWMATLGLLTTKPTYRGLKGRRGYESHHVVQGAAVDNLPGYSKSRAAAVRLRGGSSVPGSPHDLASREQSRLRALGRGGTYGAERIVAYRALRAGGLSRPRAKVAIRRADRYFGSIGVNRGTRTRIPSR